MFRLGVVRCLGRSYSPKRMVIGFPQLLSQRFWHSPKRRVVGNHMGVIEAPYEVAQSDQGGGWGCVSFF